MTLGAVLFLTIAVAMYVAGLPFAGIPLPVRDVMGEFAQLALWSDCMAGAALFALPGIARWRRVRRHAPPGAAPARGG